MSGPKGTCIVVVLLTLFILPVAHTAAADSSENSQVAANSANGRQALAVYRYQRKPSTMEAAGTSLSTFLSDPFIGSGRCANCHDLLRDAAGNDMSISNHWRSTMMANAARDPFWQAKVASEVDRNPAIRNIIEKKCSTCHMPMAYTESKKTEQYQPAILGSGFLDARNPLHAAAMDGVSCSLCHQIQDRDLGLKEGYSGQFTIDTSLSAPERELFGPYKNPVQKTMRTSVGFTPVFGPQINTAEFCGTCHTLYTPFLDAGGNVAGEFPEQAAFLEWRHSIYAQSSKERRDIGETDADHTMARLCQECHMPHSTGGPVTIARYAPPQTVAREHFSQHHFVGGNVMMLDLLQENANVLGLSASSKNFAATRQRTMKQLQNDAAELTIAHSERKADELQVQIRIVSKVGHKFPTGFPSRRAWVHLQVLAENGDTVFESGRPHTDGSIAGNDNDLDPFTYEPHYKVISSEDQVQIYETIMHDTDRQVTYTLLRAAGFLKDNRLLPAGFDKKTAGPDIAVFGHAADDADFGGGGDTVTYRVPLPPSVGRLTVRATLLYSSLSRAFFMDLALDDSLSKVRSFISMVNTIDKLPVVVGSAETVL